MASQITIKSPNGENKSYEISETDLINVQKGDYVFVPELATSLSLEIVDGSLKITFPDGHNVVVQNIVDFISENNGESINGLMDKLDITAIAFMNENGEYEEVSFFEQLLALIEEAAAGNKVESLNNLGNDTTLSDEPLNPNDENENNDDRERSTRDELSFSSTSSSNNAPTATAKSDAVLEDEIINGKVAFSDIDGTATIGLTAGRVAPEGFTINPDGTYTFDANSYDYLSEGEKETFSIPLTVTDNEGATTTTVLTVSITGTNDAPTLTVENTKTVDEDGSTTITFTASDIDGTTTTNATAEHGTVSVNENGTITYTPDANYNGADTITVTSTDDDGATVTQTSAITVNDVNDAPTLTVENTKTVDEDGSTTITFTASDIDGTTTTNATAEHGTVSVNENGTITYTPDANYNGADTITVTSTDDDGATVTQTSAITVNDVNDAPTLTVENTKTVDEDGSTTITFTASDIDGTTTTNATAEHGTVSVNENGTITYTPDANYNGADTITVTSTDDDGATVTQTSAITVNDVNDAPTLTVENTKTVDEDGSTTITFTASDIDGTTTTNATAEHGTVSVNENGTITYTPDANYNGADTITVTSTDDDGATVTQTSAITVNDVNDAPTLTVENTKTVDEDGSTTITFTASDIDGTTTTNATAEHGTVSVNENGTITYTPDANYNGADTITVTSTDDDGATVTQTSAITVNDVNDAPTLTVENTKTVDEDGSTTITFTASDIDGTTTTNATAEHGTVSVNENGTITYTPDANYNGADTITVTSTDDDGATVTQTSAITVNDVNDAPTLTVENTKTVDEDGSTTITFTASDIDGTTTTNATAEHGTVSVNENGTITYTPDANYNGADTITVTSTDDDGATVTQTSAITVNDVNDAPTLTVENTKTVDEDGSTTITFTASDIDGTTTTNATAEHGTVSVNENGTITYTPDANYNGADTITVTSTDDDGATVTQTSAITVNDVNDAPTLTVENTKTVDEDGSTTITFTASDIDGTTTTNATAEHGTVSVNENGTITYTPDANYNGADTITVTSTDDDGATVTQTSAITVNDVNDAPTLTVENTKTVDEDGSTTITFTASDIDGTTTTNATAEHGTVSVNENGTITYTPDANYNGTDSITVTSTDDDGATVTQTSAITVNDVNDAPTLTVENTKTVDEDGSTTITFTASDIDGTTTTNATAEHGTVSVNENGTITYTPDANYNGTDTITVTSTDDDGATVTQTSAITVNDVNDAPTLTVENTKTVDEDGSTTITFTASDIDGTTTTNATAEHGTVSVNENGTITYTPDANYNGADTITVTSTDDDGATVTQTSAITVNDVNDAPTLTVENTKTVDEDGSTTITFTASDIDGTTTTNATAEHGTVSVNENGTITYTPDANYNGADTITVTSTDDDGATVTQTSAITVNDVNDAPTLTVENTKTVDEDGSTTITFTASDIDGTTTTNATAEHGTVTVNNDGTITYTPDANYNGTDSITVTTTDDDGATVTKTSSITVEAVADAPTIDMKIEKATTIDDTSAVDISKGYTVIAIGANGEESTISTVSNTNHDGFGVSGNASGADSEIGYNDALGASEKIQVNLDNDASDANVSFAWQNSNETVQVEFYKDGVLIDTQTIHGGSDGVDDIYTLSPNGSDTFDSIVFSAAGSGDDFLIHEMNFNSVSIDENTGEISGEIYSINLSAALADTDGSEVLTVTVSGIPEGVSLSEGIDNGDGTWTIEVNGNSFDGTISMSVPSTVSQEFTVTATATSTESSNNATASTSATFDIDAGTFVTADIASESDTGISSTDNITSDNTPTISGITENGATVVITDANGNEVGTTVADENGNYSITTSALPDGTQNLTITATDSEGNTGVETQTITVDTTASDMANLAITDIVDNTGDYSSVTMKGTGAEAGNAITIFDEAGNAVATATVDENGTWSADISELSATGINDNEFFSVTETDIAGNETGQTDSTQYWHGDWSAANTESSDDFVMAGSGDDTINTDATLSGTNENGTVTSDNDDANDKVVIDGGAGNDTVTFGKDISEYTITTDANGNTIVTETAASDSDGDGIGDVTELRNVETVEFADGSYDVANGTFTPDNTAPEATNDTVSTSEDVALALSINDFGYSDSDGDSMSAIQIVSLPIAGAITLNGVEVSAGDEISASDINSGNLVFTPETNSDADVSFDFKVSDGTAWSDTATTSITVDAVADAPINVSIEVGQGTESVSLSEVVSESANEAAGIYERDGNYYQMQSQNVETQVLDIAALKEKGYTINNDGDYFKINSDGAKVLVEQEFTREVTKVVDAEPIMKTATETTTYETLGEAHIDNGAVVNAYNTVSFDFAEPTSNIELDFSNFDSGMAKISFYDANGNQVGDDISQYHVNDSRGYTVPDGAVGVSVSNMDSSSDFTIDTISYRGEPGEVTVEAGGLVPDYAAMEAAGITWTETQSETITQSADITNIGNIGDSNVRGFNPEDHETSQVFDFGADLAYREVTITVNMDVKGSWDNNSSSTNDYFRVSANGQELDVNYYSNRSYGHESEEVSYLGWDNFENYTYEYQVYLDENGQAQLDFMVASTADNETVDVKNIDVAYEGQTGWVKEVTETETYTESVLVDAPAEQVQPEDIPGGVPMKTLVQSHQVEVEVDPKMTTVSEVIATIYPVDIVAALADVDGSEALSVTITGVPTGATLSQGTDNGDGTWSINVEDDATSIGEHLTISVPAGTENFDLGVTATATETSTDEEIAQSDTDSVVVDSSTESNEDANTINANNNEVTTGTDADDIFSISIDGEDPLSVTQTTIDGGEGYDTVAIADAGVLDFDTLIAKNVEEVNLENNQLNSLEIDSSDVINMTDDDNILKIIGDSGDEIGLTSEDNDSSWVKTDESVTTDDGETFDVWRDDNVTVFIDTDITVTDI
ncbi:MAG: tandem-95 repeat protein [Arcobacter sp.]|uniref:tandem-95 repeat protein n=1 Tax=Arcobacter sp. TaxID=1872629 RepID=UPI003AFFD62E